MESNRPMARKGGDVGGQNVNRKSPLIKGPTDLDVALPLSHSGTHGSNQNSENIGAAISKKTSAPAVLNKRR